MKKKFKATSVIGNVVDFVIPAALLYGQWAGNQFTLRATIGICWVIGVLSLVACMTAFGLVSLGESEKVRSCLKSSWVEWKCWATDVITLILLFGFGYFVTGGFWAFAHGLNWFAYYHAKHWLRVEDAKARTEWQTDIIDAEVIWEVKGQ